MEQSKINNANDVTDQQRKSMSEVWSHKIMAEYDERFKANARIAHDKLLDSLPPYTDPLEMKDAYENEVNPSLLEPIASDLERLAKLLPSSRSGLKPKRDAQ